MGLWTDSDQRQGGYEWLHVPERAPAADPPPPPEPPKRRRTGRIIAAAVALTVVLAAGTTFLVNELFGPGPDEVSSAAPLAVSGGATKTTRINQIYREVSDGVVNIQAASGSSIGTGSGFVVDTEGTIVTNDHVVANAREVRVSFDDNGTIVRAKVLGTDPSTDLAVLRVDPKAVDLKPLTLADSSRVRVGDNVVAIGYPLGLDRTATAGIVSGLNRTIKAQNKFSIDRVIQTDAPINPGNSGGPLLDDRGRVIGVNSQIATGGGRGNIGIGFAVPSNTVRDVVPTLEKGQAVKRAYLGVVTKPASGRQGAMIYQVTPGSPAEAAGLRGGASGDVIVEFDGRRIASQDELGSAVSGKKPDEEVKVVIERGGQRQTVTVRLKQQPKNLPGSARRSP